MMVDPVTIELNPCRRCITATDGTRYYCGEHRARHVDVDEGTILYLDSPGGTAAGLDRLRPQTTIDRAVDLGLTREQATHLNRIGDLDAIVRIGERALDASRHADLTQRIDVARLAIAPPPPTGNRLARRTAKAEQRRARR